MRQPSLPIEERLSWLASLLPFLEEEIVAQYNDSIDWSLGWAAEKNKRCTLKPRKTFQCPGQVIEPSRQSWPNTSYVGITGLGVDAASLSLANERCGVFGYERHVKKEDVKDGTSCTLVILETALDNGHWAAGGSATVRPIDPEQQPYIGEDRPFGIDHRQPSFGSFHFTRQPLVTNAAMLDGSVRTLEASINPRVLEALATIAGNESIPADF